MGPVREARILVENLEANIARLASDESVLVDVSADAYGHGAAVVIAAARAAGVDRFFVGRPDEASRVAELAPGARIILGRASSDGTAASPFAPIASLTGARVVRDEVYGFDPAANAAMSLRSRVLSTKAISAGDGVSYGYTFRAARVGRTALVGIGYGDGVHRHAGNTCSVTIEGERRPIVGRVAMNVFVVLLGDGRVVPGTPVELFGDPGDGAAGVREWAADLGVESAAVTAGIGRRVERTLS